MPTSARLPVASEQLSVSSGQPPIAQSPVSSPQSPITVPHSPHPAPRSPFLRYWDTPFAVELLLLALTAPVLYFPGRFESQEIAVAVGILAAGWVWRRLTIGVWFRRTPADWPLFFLFLVMLPVSVWAAPGPLREEYSIPRALILIWNFALFWTVVSHASRRRELFHLCVWGFGAIGVGIAVAALAGTAWPAKFPYIGALLSRLPAPLLGRFDGAESGFHPNQVAGTLLYILPLLIALAVYELLRRWRIWQNWLPAGLAATLMGLVLLLSQSRGGLLGLAAGILVMLLIHRRWGRWLIVGTLLGIILLLPILPFSTILGEVGKTTGIGTSGVGIDSWEGRIELWGRALLAISDFPFTGMGLGTFRKIVQILYPLFLVSPDFDIAHAHNFFLQVALDFGLPGLIALLAIYILAIGQGIRFAHADSELGPVYAIGLTGCLVAQSVYSMSDTVAMGSKPNFIFWYLLALLFVLPMTTIYARQKELNIAME